ncbi:hypothetical protein VSS74_05660 [Conexibacter stalactiti]|uniref:DUF4267 domain-containing protein n=1 Tax=Conexibacter stalactiti TaxID=1940611 RepID=A0ABU4HMM5_9ACTN|nr:hypothetical protein [Conexibacter stalactiti]MDW5593810.1 hypothetical protein [Conexibacter stalactiti]MEC5034452.1 hypothetical protein [Conexibacter stalactiti]
MTPRTLVAGIALGRLALGAALVAAPKKVVGPGWIGAEAERPAAGVLLRAVGARDVALALGTLAALKQGSSLTPWVVGASIADGTDFLGTLAAGQAIPIQGRAGVGLLAGGALGLQLGLLKALDS